jgi:hypothetical protein
LAQQGPARGRRVGRRVRAQSPSPDRFTPAPELSDQKLEAAAAALARMSILQNDYKQRVAEAKAPAERERIMTEANNEVTKAVTDQGLSVDEYVAILEVAREHPAVREKYFSEFGLQTNSATVTWCGPWHVSCRRWCCFCVESPDDSRVAAVAGEIHRYGLPRTDLEVTLIPSPFGRLSHLAAGSHSSRCGT